MRRIYVLLPFALAGLLSFAACVGAPESVETEGPLEEPVGESQQAIQKKWDHIASLRMGGSGVEESPRVATDSSGNMIVAGTFSGSITVGGGATALTSAGGTDIFVVKLSPAGAVLWSTRFGGAGADTAAGVAVDGSGNVIVTGQMAGPVDFGAGPVNGVGYLLKLNACGTHVWSKGITEFQPGAWFNPRDVDANASGTVVLGGELSGVLDFGGTIFGMGGGGFNRTPFVQAFAPDGSFLWGHVVGSADTMDPEPVDAVDIDDTGHVAIVGSIRFSFSLNGCHANATMPYTDVFVAKLGPTGSCLWGATFGATDGQIFDQGVDVALGANGSVIAAGSVGPAVIGGMSIPAGRVLVSYTAAGAAAWARPFGSAYIGGIATDAAGVVNVGGRFAGSLNAGGQPLLGAGSHDVFLARYTASNVHLWSARYGNALAQGAGSAAVAPNGNAIFTGTFEGSMSFGGPTLTSAGAADMFLARYGVVYAEADEAEQPLDQQLQ